MPTAHSIPTSSDETDQALMRLAINLAQKGEGYVEPNPMVGAVVVKEGKIVGSGWHHAYGREHAEIDAIRRAGESARNATIYVSLEPCCHQGKTPPCTNAIVAAGISRVVVAIRDPFPEVAGKGISQLREAGIECVVGVAQQEAKNLIAPYLMRQSGRPWVIAKWAMSMDGKIATASGESKWITNELARDYAHRLRGRVDAILVGSRTALLDDPKLTSRPRDPTFCRRQPTRIVFDSAATLAPESTLAQTASEQPTIIALARQSPTGDQERLAQLGVELLPLSGKTHADRLHCLLAQLAERDVTNLLVEGGGTLLGLLHELQLLDEVHTFIAPILIGGKQAPTPLDGQGIEAMNLASKLVDLKSEQLGDNTYLRGRVAR